MAAKRIISAVKIEFARKLMKKRLKAVKIIQQKWRFYRLKRKKVVKTVQKAAPLVDLAVNLGESEERFSEIPEERAERGGEERVSMMLEAVLRPGRTTIDTISSELAGFGRQLEEERGLRLRAEQDRDHFKHLYDDLKLEYDKLSASHTQLTLQKPSFLDSDSLKQLTSNLFSSLDSPQSSITPDELSSLHQQLSLKDKDLSILRLKLDSLEKRLKLKEQEIKNAKEAEIDARKVANSQAEEILQLKKSVKGEQGGELKVVKMKYLKAKEEIKAREEEVERVRREKDREIESLRTDYDKAVLQLKEKSSEISSLTSAYKSQVESIQQTNLEQFKEQLLATRDQFKAIIDKKNAEINAVKRKLEEADAEKSQFGAMQEFFQEQIAQKESELEEKVKKERELEREIQSLHDTNLRLNSAYSELKHGLGDSEIEGKPGENRVEIEQLATEIEHSKKINSTLVTLLRYKNTELDFYRKPGEMDENYRRKLDKMRGFETDLLQK